MIFYADNYDITAIAGGLSWQNTIAELATTMNFETAKLDAQHTNVYIPTEGSIVSLVTNEEIFRGIVLTVDDGSATSNKYTAVDFGFYLNKNEDTYQFADANANQVLSRLCADFVIPVDSICDIPFSFSKIYLDKSVGDIIKDILEQAAQSTGYTYNFDVTPRGLRVYRLGDLHAYPEFRLSSNTQLIYSPTLRGGVSHSVSIEDMKNSVKVVSGDENGFRQLAIVKNDALIKKYGMLQTVKKLKDDEAGSADSIARQMLRELSQKKETFSIEIIEAEDSYTRAGYELEVEDVKFIIEGSAHSIKNGVHYVKLDLRRVVV